LALDGAGLFRFEAARLLTFDRTRLAALEPARLLTLNALLGRGKAATLTATVATTAHHGLTATAAAVSLLAAAAFTVVLRRGLGIALVAAVVAAGRLRSQRGRNRHSGNARGKNQPGHGESPFERGKRSVRCTVPTPKRVEDAL
jgi:hypothetical protein